MPVSFTRTFVPVTTVEKIRALVTTALVSSYAIAPVAELDPIALIESLAGMSSVNSKSKLTNSAGVFQIGGYGKNESVSRAGIKNKAPYAAFWLPLACRTERWLLLLLCIAP